MTHINRLYSAQSHFHERLGELIGLHDFFDLQTSLEEAIFEMAGQIKNTNDLYHSYDCNDSLDSNSALLQFLEEDFFLVQINSGNLTLRNLNLLSYIQNIQSIIINSFQILQLCKVQMNQQKAELLDRNFTEMKLGQSLKLMLLEKVQFV